MIGHYLSSNNKICYSTQITNFSPTKQGLNIETEILFLPSAITECILFKAWPSQQLKNYHVTYQNMMYMAGRVTLSPSDNSVTLFFLYYTLQLRYSQHNHTHPMTTWMQTLLIWALLNTEPINLWNCRSHHRCLAVDVCCHTPKF